MAVGNANSDAGNHTTKGNFPRVRCVRQFLGRTIVNTRISLRRFGLALALGVHFLVAPSHCRAGPLLTLDFQPGAPNVSGSNGGITYDAATGDFHAMLSGASLVYAAPSVAPRGFAPFSGSLNMDVMVDHNGNFVSNGTGLVLTGSVTINGAVFSGTLLTAKITAFGADDAGPPTRTFDGVFEITGGALTTTQPGTGGEDVSGGFPVGSLGGFILSAEDVRSGTLGDFTQSFSSTGGKPLIGVLTPEPSTLVLALTGAVGLTWWRKRKIWRQLLARMPYRAQAACKHGDGGQAGNSPAEAPPP